MVRSVFLWALVLGLFVALLVQLAVWKNLRHEAKQLVASDDAENLQKHRKLQAKIDEKRQGLESLETATLWEKPHQILPQLASAAQALSVELVGVEELAIKRHGDYQSVPLHLTFSGTYEGFAAFLEIVEKITPPVRIDNIRLYERERYPSLRWLDLTISPLYKEKRATPTEIQVPQPSPLMIPRDPFTFGSDPPVSVSQPTPVPPQVPLPKLTGILWDSDAPLAVFTDHRSQSQFVPVGGKIADAELVEIQPQKVVLMRDGERYVLQFRGADGRFSVR